MGPVNTVFHQVLSFILAFIKAQSKYKGSLHLLAEIAAVLFQRVSLFEILDLDINHINRIKHPPPLQMSIRFML